VALPEPDGGIGNSGQRTQHAFDFERMHFFSADVGPLSGATQEHQFAAAIPFAEVAQPPVSDARRHRRALDRNASRLDRDGNAASGLPAERPESDALPVRS